MSTLSKDLESCKGPLVFLVLLSDSQGRVRVRVIIRVIVWHVLGLGLVLGLKSKIWPLGHKVLGTGAER